MWLTCKFYNFLTIVQILLILDQVLMVTCVRPPSNRGRGRGNQVPAGLREITSPSSTPSRPPVEQSIRRPVRQTPQALSPTSRITRQTARQQQQQVVHQHLHVQAQQHGSHATGQRQMEITPGTQYGLPSTQRNGNRGQRGEHARQRRLAREAERPIVSPLTPPQPLSTQSVIQPGTRQSPRLRDLAQRRGRESQASGLAEQGTRGSTAAAPTYGAPPPSSYQRDPSHRFVTILNPGHEQDPTKIQAGVKSPLNGSKKHHQ